MSEINQLRLERDLYRRLLGLAAQTELEPFLKEALTLIVEVTRAQKGYLELHDPRDRSESPGWYISHGFSDVQTDDVRAMVSRGIIAEALATGETIDTPSAILDPRFSDRSSVQATHIEAVLCIPFSREQPIGALYLQGRKDPAPFASEDRERAEIFAQHLARLADHLLLRLTSPRHTDPTLPLRDSLQLDGVIGSSDALAQLLREIASASPIDISLILLGDSGTGKSMVARVIHDNGPRANQPFVEVNCGALPDELVESELFGAMQGAHSTATREIVGKVAAAERGTLFLDEVADLSMGAQAKLLQLLQSKNYYRLGASEPTGADIRLIAATNVDLEEAVAEKRFREDLYYRLHVLPIRIPTLAERRADIPDLISHFCEDACARHSLPNLKASPGLLRAAENAEWPGQIRQLQHAVEAAAVRAVAEGTLEIQQRHLFPGAGSDEPEGPMTFQDATRVFQAKLLRDTLSETAWNVSETARRLDLARSHVYNLIRAFELKRSND